MGRPMGCWLILRGGEGGLYMFSGPFKDRSAQYSNAQARPTFTLETFRSFPRCTWNHHREIAPYRISLNLLKYNLSSGEKKNPEKQKVRIKLSHGAT